MLPETGVHLLNQLLRITVADSGEGIPGDPEMVFEAFTSTKADGMGMGLTISRSIVEAHTGRLIASNGDAGGAKFAVILPLQSRDE